MTDGGGTPEPTDLFKQWLAHREGRPVDGDEAEDAAAPPGPAGLEEPSAPEPSTPEPSTPEPRAPEPRAEEPEGTPEQPAPRRPAHAGPPPVATELPNHNTAAASILAALQADEKAGETAAPEPVATRPAPGTALPAGALAGEPAVPAARTDPTPMAAQPGPAATSLPHTIFFKPRAGTQRVLGLLQLVFLVITVAAGWWAWHQRDLLGYAVFGAAAAVTAITWATRASAGPARLTLHGSELEIVRNGSRALFDLAHTQVELHGTPGSRTWRVLLLRRSMSPYVIDGSMVDPREFTEVVRFFHPEV